MGIQTKKETGALVLVGDNYISCVEYTQLGKKEIKEQISKSYNKPKLVVIQVGDNSASNSYIRGKEKDCNEVGIDFQLIKLPNKISEEELLNRIKYFNYDENTNELIVQLPLPKHINVNNIKQFISPNKDVDGFHKDSKFIPCTPLGIINYLKYNNIEIKGKHVVVLGRSDIVGKPISKLMLKGNATVTICHSYTNNLKFYTQNADIIISAIGKPKFITKEYISSNKPIIIDVGINRDDNNKLCGDIDYDSVAKYCELITSVPKGVGLLTRLSLLENTYYSYLKNVKK